MDIEINPIAISADLLNLRIANLVEHLLILDQKMFEADKKQNPRGPA